MGNELEKEYNIKQKPIKLPGSYTFLKFIDHPTDSQSSLVIVKQPHKVGVISSDILLSIKEVKTFGSDYSVAKCKKCTPLSLFKPRAEVEMKLIIWSIIKNSTELGRIFVCNGRLNLWCEETRTICSKSPEQIEGGKQTEKSKVFTSGICLINYLSCIYEKQKGGKKKSKPKTEIDAFFNPKDKKQYLQFLSNLELKLDKSTFWNQISEGMKNLILAMLAKQPADRIDKETLLELPYFSTEKQLKLYDIIADDLADFQQKQTIMFMETLQMVIKNRTIIDELVLQNYFTPVMIQMLERKPDMILSALIELQNCPVNAVYWCLKKGNPKNLRMVSIVLRKKQRLLQLLNEQMYDAGMSRMIFSSYESEVLLERAIHATPFLMKNIKQANYRKQIQFLLVHKVLQQQTKVPHRTLLLALKCAILMLEENLFTNPTKLYGLNYNPTAFEEELEINLHILHLYQLLIKEIEPTQLIIVMMPKLQPYLSNDSVTDELFFMAKNCVNLIMQNLTKVRDLNEEDIVNVEYQKQFFTMPDLPKPSEQQVIVVLRKEVSKSKNKNLQWLDGILENQHLIDL